MIGGELIPLFLWVRMDAIYVTQLVAWMGSRLL